MENFKEMSIFLLFLLVGVSVSRYINADDDDTDVLQPIISQTRQRRICAELCMSGLGGDPCGEGCVDLMPGRLPVQFIQAGDTDASKNSVPYSNSSRHDMCDVLCENNLGNPLCQCNITKGLNTNYNFFDVCRMFCTKHKYRIYGCQKCDVYTKISEGNNFTVHTLVINDKEKTTFDWNGWCVQMCSKGDGGAACSCDLMPMNLHISTT